MNANDLIDRVLEQVKADVKSEDLTALAELLKFLPEKNLKAYLPDDIDLFNAYYGE